MSLKNNVASSELFSAVYFLEMLPNINVYRYEAKILPMVTQGVDLAFGGTLTNGLPLLVSIKLNAILR